MIPHVRDENTLASSTCGIISFFTFHFPSFFTLTTFATLMLYALSFALYALRLIPNFPTGFRLYGQHIGSIFYPGTRQLSFFKK